MIRLKGSSSRGGLSKKSATRHEPGQNVTGKRRQIWAKPEITQGMAVNQPKAPGRGVSIHGTITIKKRVKIKFQRMYLAKILKSKSRWRLL